MKNIRYIRWFFRSFRAGGTWAVVLGQDIWSLKSLRIRSLIPEIMRIQNRIQHFLKKCIIKFFHLLGRHDHKCSNRNRVLITCISRNQGVLCRQWLRLFSRTSLGHAARTFNPITRLKRNKQPTRSQKLKPSLLTVSFSKWCMLTTHHWDRNVPGGPEASPKNKTKTKANSTWRHYTSDGDHADRWGLWNTTTHAKINATAGVRTCTGVKLMLVVNTFLTREVSGGHHLLSRQEKINNKQIKNTTKC